MEILEEFSDVTPILEDTIDGICKITYAPHFAELIGMLRACILSGELSDRVFRLTTAIILINPSFVSAWVVRQQCILQNGIDYDKEFSFLDEVRRITEKCYQTWMHRMFLVEISNSYANEKEYCDSYIRLDSKNIHSWTYRHWVVEKYNLWEGEMEYTEKYITSDIFNNSAWSYRFYVFTHESKPKQEIDVELEFVMDILKKAPHNDAAWNYLKGLLTACPTYSFIDIVNEVKKRNEEVLGETGKEVPGALDFLVSYCRKCYEIERTEEAIEYAIRLQKADDVRKAYWQHMEEELRKDKEYLEFVACVVCWKKQANRIFLSCCRSLHRLRNWL